MREARGGGRSLTHSAYPAVEGSTPESARRTYFPRHVQISNERTRIFSLGPVLHTLPPPQLPVSRSCRTMRSVRWGFGGDVLALMPYSACWKSFGRREKENSNLHPRFTLAPCDWR